MRINLPPQLYQEVHRLLLALDVCENYSALKGRLTAVNELHPFANTLPKRENPKAQADALIAHLHDGQTAVSQQNPLVFFLRHWATGISEHDRHRVELEETAHALEAEMAHQQRWLERCNPYRGLEAFQEEHERFFFGRETFTQQLLERVQETNFVAIIGASGSGKSSVVRAGLLPVLRRTGQWQLITLRPSENPFRALAQAMIPAEVQGEPRLRQIQSLQHGWVQGELTLDDVMVNSLTPLPQDRLLLFVDQFEELFTLCPDRETQHRFIDLLLSGLKNPACTVLLTMRADFMGQATAYRPLADTLHTYPSMILGPMNADELQQAIAKPATSLGIRFETGLAERILDDVQDEPGNLPLLQFALTELWDDQKTDFTHYTLKQETYTQMGKVQGALTQYADKVYATLSPNQQQEARHIFTQLVQPGLGTEDTRKRATIDEIGAERWPLVQQLADKRLIVTNENENTQQAEVAHEALIAQWGQLQAWMNEDRAFRVWQERLRQKLRQWQENDKHNKLLLEDVLLSEAERWLADKHEELQLIEVDYIELSGDYHQQKEKRRRQLAIGVTAVSIIVTLLFALLALDRSDQAQNAINSQATSEFNEEQAQLNAGEANRNAMTSEARLYAVETAQANAINESNARATEISIRGTAEANAISESNARATAVIRAEQEGQNSRSNLLSATSRLHTENNPTLASLLAIEALRLNGNAEALSILNTTIPNLGGDLLYSFQHTAHIRTAKTSSDNKYLVTVSHDDEMYVWDMQTGEKLWEVKEDIAWSSSVYWLFEDTIIYVNSDWVISLFNALTGELITKFTYSEYDDRPSLSKSKEYLVAKNANNEWNILSLLATHKTIPLAGSVNSVKNMKWSPDDMFILAIDDYHVFIWDSVDGRLRHRINQGFVIDSLPSRIFNDDSSMIFVKSDSTLEGLNQINIIDLDSGNLVWNYSSEEYISAEWINNNEILINDTVYNVKTGNNRQNDSVGRFSSYSTYGYSISPNNDYIFGTEYSGGNARDPDYLGRVYDLSTGELLFEVNHDGVLHVDWNSNSDILMTGGKDNFARLWQVPSGELLNEFPHADRVKNVQFIGEDKVLTVSDDESVNIWSFGDKSEISWLVSQVIPINYSYDSEQRWIDNRYVFIAGDRWIVWDTQVGDTHFDFGDVQLGVWNNTQDRLAFMTDEELHVWSNGNMQSQMIFSLPDVINLFWHPIENWLILIQEEGLTIWDIDANAEILTLSQAGINEVLWSNDNKQLYTILNNSIISWGFPSGQEIWTINNIRPGTVRLSQNNGLLASSDGWNGDDKTIIWDTTNGQEIFRIPQQITFWDHTNSIIVADSVEGVFVWDLNTFSQKEQFVDYSFMDSSFWNQNTNHFLFQKHDLTQFGSIVEIRNFQDNSIVNLEYSANLEHSFSINHAYWFDSHSLFIGVDGNTMIAWDTTTWKPIGVLSQCGVEGVWLNYEHSILISDGGRQLGCQEDVKTWNISTGELLFQIEGWVAGWSEDRTILATGNGKIVNVITGNTIFDMGFTVGSGDVSFNPNSTKLLVRENSQIYIIDRSTEYLIDQACTYMSRNFTWLEWKEFFPSTNYRQTCDTLPVHQSVPEQYLP